MYFVVLLGTMDIGFGRDEGYYFKAGELYARWFDDVVDSAAAGEPLRPFTQKGIEARWSYNPEHPVIYKTLFGLSWRLFGRMGPEDSEASDQRLVKRWYERQHQPSTLLGLTRESTAFRLPTAVTAALLLWLLYLFGVEAWDRRVGLTAALLFATMPRVFYHAHLAAFDLPTTFWNLLTIYTFWRSLRGGRGAAALCGVVWGISLGVKLNAFFTPGILLLWWVVAHRREFRLKLACGPLGISPRIPKIPRAFFAMALLGPVVFLALWPRMWFDTWPRLVAYVLRHWHHEYYWAYFFGTLLVKPPFPVSFPFAMSLVTIPVTTLALFFGGVFASVTDPSSRGRFHATSLVALAALIPFVVIANPGTPVFGGTKHWLPAMPFLALFAGVGLVKVSDALLSRLPEALEIRRWASLPVIGLFVLPPAYAVAHSHPDEVAYYNELLGGMAGMGEQQMQREFWGSTAGHVLPWLNETLPKRAMAHWHDTNYESYRLYLRDGRLRPDIKFIWNEARSRYFLFHWHKEFLDLSYDMQGRLGGGVPHHVYARDGVPLLVSYGPPPVVEKAKTPPTPKQPKLREKGVKP